MPRCAWILGLIAMTASASAQSAHVQAEALFRQGKELMKQNQLVEACAAFESSQVLEPSISTLLNHADCREKNAQLATAWGLFIDAERQTRTQPDSASKQLNVVAAARAGRLEARLSKLSIDVAPASQVAGLEVLRGAERVEPGTWNLSLPIDGGTYKITARAPGRVGWSTTVVVKPEGDAQTVTVPKLDPAASGESTPGAGIHAPARTTGAGPAGKQPADASAIHPASARPDGAARRSLALPIAMGGAALVLGGGSVFAFSRWGDRIYADAEREPNDAKQESLWRSANQRRYAAIGFAVGTAGCVGAAIYLYLRGGGREAAQPPASRSLHLEPTATAGSMSLGLRGAW